MRSYSVSRVSFRNHNEYSDLRLRESQRLTSLSNRSRNCCCGLGNAYLGWDKQLKRAVAIKVADADWDSAPEQFALPA